MRIALLVLVLCVAAGAAEPEAIPIPLPGEDADGLMLAPAAGGAACRLDAALPADAASLALWVSPVAGTRVEAVLRDARGQEIRQPFAIGAPRYGRNRGWGLVETARLDRDPQLLASGVVRALAPPLRLESLVVRGAGGVRLAGLAAVRLAAAEPPPWEVASLDDPGTPRTWRRMDDTGRALSHAGRQGRPGVPAGALVDGPGAWQVAVRVRQGWQGPVVAEQELALEVGPTPGALRQTVPIAFPHRADDPDADYMAELRVRRAGVLHAVRRFWVSVDGRELAAAGPSAAGLAPATAGMRLDPVPGGVLAGIPAAPQARRLRLAWRTWAFADGADQDVDLAAGQAWTRTLAAPAGPGPWRLDASLLAAEGALLDRDHLVVAGDADAGGVPDWSALAAPPAPPAGALGSAFSAWAVPPDGVSLAEAEARIARGMALAKAQGQTVVELNVQWSDLEPLPGVYQFAWLDRLLALGSAQGLPVAVSPWLFGDAYPRWRFARQARYDDGASVLRARGRFVPSLADAPFAAQAARLWSALAARYRHHPALAGWIVTGPCLDHGWYDRPGEADLGFEPGGIAGAVRAEWSGAYDLRPAWGAWLDAREDLLLGWNEGVFAAIRAADDAHAVWRYLVHGVGQHARFLPQLARWRVGATTGGSEMEQFQKFNALFAQAGIPFRGEPFLAQRTTPPALAMGLWAALACGGSQAAYSMQWHDEFPEDWSDADGAARRARWNRTVSNPLEGVEALALGPHLARWAPVLRELAGAAPPPLAAGSWLSYAQGRHRFRSQHFIHVGGNALLTAWNADARIQPRWLPDGAGVEAYDGLRLLVLDADAAVLARTDAARIAAWVASGGTLLLPPEAGRWTPDGAADPLPAALGLAWPAGDGASPAPPAATLERPGAAPVAIALAAHRDLPAFPAARVLATTADGAPALLRIPHGAGAVLLSAGPVRWAESPGLLAALAAAAGVPRRVDIDLRDGRVARLERAGTVYLLAGRPLEMAAVDGASGRPRAGSAPVNAHVRAYGLPAGRYRVVELLAGDDLGERDAADLATGIALPIAPGELRVLRLAPLR